MTEYHSSDTAQMRRAANAPSSASHHPQKDNLANRSVVADLVAVCASDDRNDALLTFFSLLPEKTSASYLIIHELTDNKEEQLLQHLRHTLSLPVKLAHSGDMLEPDALYILSAEQDVFLHDNRICLRDKRQNHELTNGVVDLALASLAETLQGRMVAVMLAGMGNDGQQGAKSVQAYGGVVLSETTFHTSVDSASGVEPIANFSDLALPLDQLPAKVVTFLDSEAGAYSDNVFFGCMNQDIEYLFHALSERTKIDFSQYKETTVARRLSRRMTLTKSKDLETYLTYLKRRPVEVATLGKELLIGVTEFFRDQPVFDLLKHKVLPSMIKSLSEEQEIRIWVPACSTGEEAYSLAMLIDEVCQQLGRSNHAIKIYATDVDSDALAQAASSRFPLDIAHHLSRERLDRYFIFCHDHYKVAPFLRKMLLFARHDLTQDPPFSNMHLVSCRNVLIYFKPAIQHQVLNALNCSLKMGGVLVLGQSELYGEVPEFFDLVDTRLRVFTKQAHAGLMPMTKPKPSPSAVSRRAMVFPDRTHLSRALSHRESLESTMPIVAELLLNRFGPASVLLDDQFRALHVFGDVSRYFRVMSSGRVSIQIADLLVDDLLVPVTTALQQAQERKEDVFYSDVAVRNAEQTFQIKLGVICIAELGFQKVPDYYVLVFDMQAGGVREDVIQFDYQEQSQKHIKYLEDQFIRQKENLQITVEEFETTNEELKVMNEQLSSANEELQSLNEELSSVNEELYSVNGEYQKKIEELIVANNDLDNVLRSTNVPMLLLDQDLKLRRFTQAMLAYMPLKPEDVGRPVIELSLKVNQQYFYHDLLCVLRQEKDISRDFKNSTNQTQLQLRMQPYKNQNQAVEGVVVTVKALAQTVKPVLLEDS